MTLRTLNTDRLSSYQRAVLAVVRCIPKGKVASYGQIAAYVGTPRAARQVGRVLTSLEGVPDFPWWRVLNNKGIITIKGAEFATKRLQRELLEAEGIEINDALELSMARYRWIPTSVEMQLFPQSDMSEI